MSELGRGKEQGSADESGRTQRTVSGMEVAVVAMAALVGAIAGSAGTHYWQTAERRIESSVRRDNHNFRARECSDAIRAFKASNYVIPSQERDALYETIATCSASDEPTEEQLERARRNRE